MVSHETCKIPTSDVVPLQFLPSGSYGASKALKTFNVVYLLNDKSMTMTREFLSFVEHSPNHSFLPPFFPFSNFSDGHYRKIRIIRTS